MIQTQHYTNSTIAVPIKATKVARIESIDLLRGVVMIIMALDHVRDFFHHDVYYYDPTDLTQTSPILFFTRFITHFCAPVFVFLAGTSAFLSGKRKSKRELSIFLLTRGIWLVFVELFILSLIKSFNPTYPYFNLQVIWAIGICMIVLSALIHLKRAYILIIGLALVFGHNLLDNVHVGGDGVASFLWSFLHEQKLFEFGRFTFFLNYPVMAWIGIMALGYCCGSLFVADENTRKKTLTWMGFSAIALFILLRLGNWYGDPHPWSIQRNAVFSFLSFMNVTKYPPSLQYTLITLGPALLFLAYAEKPLRQIGEKIVVYGRVPMFYYILHFLLIHSFASIAGVLTGYPEMVVLSKSIFRTPEIQGYGFNLAVVYLIWIGLVLLLYPICKWYDRYKRENLSRYPFLSYL